MEGGWKGGGKGGLLLLLLLVFWGLKVCFLFSIDYFGWCLC